VLDAEHLSRIDTAASQKSIFLTFDSIHFCGTVRGFLGSDAQKRIGWILPECIRLSLLRSSQASASASSYAPGLDVMGSLSIFRERSRTALPFSRSAIACLIGEVLFRHSFGISPPLSFPFE
jgi:hypothetical protein